VDNDAIGEKTLQIAADLGVGNFAGSDVCLVTTVSVS
jgi:hypothetical protein